jgi:xanthine dehydrogenase accessory factor
VSAEALARIASPAGLDLGAHAPAEIAVSILAQIVQRRRAGTTPTRDQPATSVLEGLAASPPPVVTEATDAVCGMAVHVASAKWRHEHAGLTYYFCGQGCRERFAKDPGRYLAAGKPGAVG